MLVVLSSTERAKDNFSFPIFAHGAIEGILRLFDVTDRDDAQSGKAFAWSRDGFHGVGTIHLRELKRTFPKFNKRSLYDSHLC